MYNGDKMVFALPPWTATADRVRDFLIHTEGRWLLDDVHFVVTTTLAGATTTPSFKIGSTADDDKILEVQQLGTLAAGNSVYSLRKLYPSKFKDATPLENGDTARVTLVAATGAGAAGVLDVYVVFRKCGEVSAI